jgi:hypothetical protein
VQVRVSSAAALSVEGELLPAAVVIA